MRTRKTSAVTFAGAGALALLLSTTSVFAAPAPQWNDGHGNDRNSPNGGNRSNDGNRQNGNGTNDWHNANNGNRSNDGNRQNGNGTNDGRNANSGYRGNDGRNANDRYGVGGRNQTPDYNRRDGGYVQIDINRRDVGYGSYGTYGNARYGRPVAVEIQGIVQQVDFRNGTLWVRDGRQLVRVDMVGRDFRQVRRGDRVMLSGSWAQAGEFTAYGLVRI